MIRSIRGAALALSVGVAGVACTDDSAPRIYDGLVPRNEPGLFRDLLRSLTEPSSLPVEGDWPEDFGDANYYGPGFFYRYGTANQHAGQVDLAAKTAAYDALLVVEAGRKIDIFMERLEEVLMAALGLVEAQAHDADAENLAGLDKMIDLLQTVARAFSYYPDASAGGEYAISTYGPTTVNATLALLQLEYAFTIGGEHKEKRRDAGLEVLAKGRELAFDEQRGFYRFVPESEDLYLYPNVSQMIALVRAHQLTGETKYLTQAQDLHAAIQPLKVRGEGRYRSPYSAKYMGAQTDDYTTLSSQNYTMIALALLYDVTGNQRYREEVRAILEFVRTRLLQGGRLLHHWMDGHLAEPTDPEYYCSGCNLQTLYLIWQLEELLGEWGRCFHHFISKK